MKRQFLGGQIFLVSGNMLDKIIVEIRVVANELRSAEKNLDNKTYSIRLAEICLNFLKLLVEPFLGEVHQLLEVVFIQLFLYHRLSDD